VDVKAVKIYLSSLNLPQYRQKQILKNYFSGHYLTFLDMTDLPKDLRFDLEKNFSLISLHESKLITDTDTQKAVLALKDNLAIESVLMNYDDWLTACVSSQVGCPLNCAFCATGKMGFKRNLTSEEIVDQILYWKNILSNPNKPPFLKGGARRAEDLKRIVFMGMGEPLLNWDNLLSALKIIKDDLNIGSRKISVSTAGIIPKIYEFADLNTEINLAISLHAPDQETRQQIMPIALKYQFPDLIKSLNYYTAHTRRQLFLEYALIDGINDSESHLDKLITLLKSNRLFYLNLIPLNPVKGGLNPSSNLNLFADTLEKNHLNFSLRRSLGKSTNSACGQLIVGN
jgi:23S rRNA (adenine2503-C2)-methyltransferase